MTDPHGRYADDPARDVSGRSLAEQPTEVVPLDRYCAREDTPPGGIQPPAPAAVVPDDRYGEPDDGRDLFGLHDDDSDGRTAPDYIAAPVAVRRADSLAGLLLVLAGIAAGVSLLLVWIRGGDPGLDLVRTGVQNISDGTLWVSGSWQPLAVVLGGGVLFLLGLLMYVPARTHRFLGVLALLVSLAVAAGVLVPFADAGWDVSGFDVGTWFAVAVAGLGLLGALKALSTSPKIRGR